MASEEPRALLTTQRTVTRMGRKNGDSMPSWAFWANEFEAHEVIDSDCHFLSSAALSVGAQRFKLNRVAFSFCF